MTTMMVFVWFILLMKMKSSTMLIFFLVSAMIDIALLYIPDWNVPFRVPWSHQDQDQFAACRCGLFTPWIPEVKCQPKRWENSEKPDLRCTCTSGSLLREPWKKTWVYDYIWFLGFNLFWHKFWCGGWFIQFTTSFCFFNGRWKRAKKQVRKLRGVRMWLGEILAWDSVTSLQVADIGHV